MNQKSGQWRVAARLEKQRLLFAINCVAALSIFFFGEYPPHNPRIPLVTQEYQI